MVGLRHRKFATNDEHFYQLDIVLDRIQRPRRGELSSSGYLPGDDMVTNDRTDGYNFGRERPDLTSSSEVSDYLPQPLINNALADGIDDLGSERPMKVEN